MNLDTTIENMRQASALYRDAANMLDVAIAAMQATQPAPAATVITACEQPLFADQPEAHLDKG